MKQTVQSKIIILLSALLILCLVSCGESKTDFWEDAIYTEDTTLGTGEKTITVTVVAEEKSVVFTIKTDKMTLGDALVEHQLVEGEQGDYGLYIKSVNGMRADYEKDGCYWSIAIGEESAMTGADGIEIQNGGEYTLACVKG